MQSRSVWPARPVASADACVQGSVANLMGRFCDQLGLSGHVADAAARIARAAAEQDIGVGRDPSTVAGAAIFMAAQLHPDDKRVTLEQIGARRPAHFRARVGARVCARARVRADC